MMYIIQLFAFFSFAVTNIFVFQVTMFAFSLMVRPELARAIP